MGYKDSIEDRWIWRESHTQWIWTEWNQLGEHWLHQYGSDFAHIYEYMEEWIGMSIYFCLAVLSEETERACMFFPVLLHCSDFSVIQIICDLHWESQRPLSTVAKVKLQLGNILFPGSRLILLIGDNHLWREAAWSLPVSDLEETLSLQEWHASIYFRTQYCALLWVINKIWDYHLTWVLLGLYWDGERP